MNFKVIASIGLLCVFLAAPALAAPALTVDLVRDGMNRPILTPGGDWQWIVRVDPDQTWFGNTSEFNPGGSVGIEIGFRLTAADLVSATVSVPNFGETDGDMIVEAGEGTPNPGTQIFTWETLTDVGGGNMQPVGLQTESASPDMGLAEIFAAFGSRIFEGGVDDGAQDFLTIVTDGPSTSGSLTTTLQWLGSAAGQAILAQRNYPATGSPVVLTNVSGMQSHTATAGDANLDGNVSLTDLSILGISFGGPANWSTGDFSGDGMATLTDLSILGITFGTMGSPPGAGAGLSAGGAVPEPTSVVLLTMGALMFGLRRRR